VIDSAVDLATSLILFWTWRAIKNRNYYHYPQGFSSLFLTKTYFLLGRTRLEPVAIIILSVIMCAASVLTIYESIDTITTDVKYFTEKNTTKTLTDIDMSVLPIFVMIITIISKAFLFIFCYRIKNPTISALAADHINDVASNIVALACGLIGII
jgi:divalent metal cation (Fe/Co/Zn/Cd) transporter